MPEAQEREAHLLDYWRVLVKRRWVVLTSLTVLVSTVAIGSLLMQKLYTATVRLQIERSAPNVLPFQQVIASIPDQLNDFYQTQYGLIQSRRVARDVLVSLKLADHADFRIRGAEALDAGAIEAKRLDRFEKRLRVTPVRNSRLVDVSFVSSDPDLAARVANRVAETYIAFNSEAQYNTSERASASLAHQVANLQDEIDAKEKELQEYARLHGIIPLNEKQSILLKNLNDLSDALTQAQAVRIEKEARHAALREADPSGIQEVLDSELIKELTAKSAELGRRRAELSGKYMPDWPEMQRLKREEEETRDRLEKERRAIYEQALGAARNAYQAALNQESYLRASLETTKKQAQEMGLKEIEYNNLKLDVANRRATLEALVKRQSETSTSAGMNEVASSNVRIVDAAEVPLKPSSPRVPLNVFLSLITGLALGCGLAFFFEYLDKSVKSVEEMQHSSGAPSIGLIPALRPEGSGLRVVRPAAAEARAGAGVDLIAHDDPKSKVSEAFRELRTTLLVSRPGGPPRSILITSAQPGEGKTTVTLNLAVSLAQIGRRVLLVDADLRKPRLHKALGITAAEGFSNDLSETGPVRLRIRPTRLPGLDLLPSGPVPPNPADLLDSERLLLILGAVETGGYDHVLFDSPPALVVADAAILAGRVDSVIVVVHAGHTGRDAVAHAAARLRQVKAHIVGCVLNRIDQGEHGYYSGYYDKRYYGEEESAPAELAAAGEPRSKS